MEVKKDSERHSLMKTNLEGPRKQEVITPSWIWRLVRYMADVMWESGNQVKDVNPPYVYREERDQGTEKDMLSDKSQWPTYGYCNPPFKHIQPFLERGIKEWETHGNRTIFLLPMRTHMPWFLSLIWGKHPVLPIAREITFEGYKSPFPAPVGLFILGTSYSDITVGAYVERPIDTYLRLHKDTKSISHKKAVVVCPRGDVQPSHWYQGNHSQTASVPKEPSPPTKVVKAVKMRPNKTNSSKKKLRRAPMPRRIER
jgi:hypothetical protein